MKNTNIKRWYKENYPNDSLYTIINPNLNFLELEKYLKQGIITNILFIDSYDSLVRERIFQKLDELSKIDIYNLWINKVSKTQSYYIVSVNGVHEIKYTKGEYYTHKQDSFRLPIYKNAIKATFEYQKLKAL